MASFAESLQAVSELKELGLIADYAIGGAMAVLFWTEAIPTFDLDVLVLLPVQESSLVSLSPIYQWAKEHGYESKQEHIEIGGVPVQFLPAYNELATEAVKMAKTLDYSGIPVRVVTPEYLVALALDPAAKSRRRRERAAMLSESGKCDQAQLADIMARYNLSW